MQVVTPADREAARALRQALADVSGFWYRLDDEGPLCQAVAQHRVQAEQRLLRQAFPEVQAAAVVDPSSGAARRLHPSIAAIVPLSGINCG